MTVPWIEKSRRKIKSHKSSLTSGNKKQKSIVESHIEARKAMI
jgi:hypothetical protein